MKKVFIVLAFLASAVKMFSQEQVNDRDYYLSKSKEARTEAHIFLIAGTALIGLGSIISGRKNASSGAAETGIVIEGAGLISILSSIPLLIASVNN